MSNEFLFSAHQTPRNSCEPRELRNGDLVIAVENIDVSCGDTRFSFGALVRAGTLGVVFAEENDTVRWFSGRVYDVGPGEAEYMPDAVEVAKAEEAPND